MLNIFRGSHFWGESTVASQRIATPAQNEIVLEMQMKCFFFIAEFERAAKIRKIAVHRFITTVLVPEL